MSIKLIEAQAVCPCDVLLQDFEGELLQQGYKPSTVLRKKRLFADLNDWLQAQGLSAGDLSYELADRFLFDRRSAGYARHKTLETLRPILDYLHRLKLAPPLEAPVPRPCQRNSRPIPTLPDCRAQLGDGNGPAVYRLPASISIPQGV